MALKAVRDGARFSIDLKKRSLKVNGKFLIRDGEYEGELHDEEDDIPMDDIITVLDDAFYCYQHSIPSERSESKSKNYFNALRLDQLEDEDMMYGSPREEARFELEVLLLIYILEGKFVWDDNKWFWQSKTQPAFVILREWVVGE